MENHEFSSNRKGLCKVYVNDGGRRNISLCHRPENHPCHIKPETKKPTSRIKFRVWIKEEYLLNTFPEDRTDYEAALEMLLEDSGLPAIVSVVKNG